MPRLYFVVHVVLKTGVLYVYPRINSESAHKFARGIASGLLLPRLDWESVSIYCHDGTQSIDEYCYTVATR